MSWRRVGDRQIWRSSWDDEQGHQAGPFVIGDGMDPVQSMADGKMYDSKAAIRRSYRADGNPRGIEFEEIGNDPERLRPPPPFKPDRAAIRTAIRRAIEIEGSR